MVNELSQIDHVFKELTALLSAEAKADPCNTPFLKYVEQRQSQLKQAGAHEVIRGINRYFDEFAFSDANAQRIKNTIDTLYDLVNH